VHDVIDLEARGIPSVFVASNEFTEAAKAQARALGAEPSRVFVPHPIQDRTDDELRSLADAALDEILGSLAAPTGGRASS
jgi:alkanesulfonate monooxygenase SsuD/methylene tetrahydromethanopterin reductase-like flavin-dependent oxidoreductase (luciferase family)